MSDPAYVEIAGNRNVPYSDKFTFLNVDWTGSTFKMQVRAVKDTTGTALLTATSSGGDITLFYADTATVSAHVTAGRLSSEIYNIINPSTGVKYQSTDSLLLSWIGIGINVAAMEAFPYPSERGKDFVGFYDIIRTPASGSPEVVMAGTFTVLAGVTIP